MKHPQNAEGKCWIDQEVCVACSACFEEAPNNIKFDEALRWLGKDIDDRDGIGSWLVWLNHDPVWKEMRKDHRWKDIQKRAGW